MATVCVKATSPVRPLEPVLQLIGNTPLTALERVAKGLKGVEIYAKAENFNPGGSVKDRPALRIILDAERDGRLTPEKIILDSTSGNTGIAYAMIGACRGYRVELAMPSNVSPERKRLVNAYGASVTFTNPLEGSDGAQLVAKQMAAEYPDRYFYADQYNNPSNWRAHYDGTGAEIIRQTKGRVTHFVAGAGTGGTVVGCGRRLKEFNPKIKVYAVQPATPLHGLEGLKHMESAIVPGIYDPSVLDGEIFVETEEAYEMVRRLASEEGLLVGYSSGAAVVAALQVAKQCAGQSGPPAVVVTVLPDGGDRYLSGGLWE